MSARSCRLRKYGKPGTTLYVLQGTTIRHVPNPGYDQRTRHLLRSDESRGVRRYVPPWWVCPVLWRKAVVAWDASAPLHDHDAGGRPLLSAGAVQPFAVDVRREFLVTSGRCARNTAVSTEAHSLQLFYRAGSIVPLPFKPIKAYGITTFPLQRKQSMKTSVPIRIHNRLDNVLCQPRPRTLVSFTTRIKHKHATI